MTCPWEELGRVPSRFCEESLCAWVRQPASTWSNIGFLVTGVLILVYARRGRSRHLRGLGLVCVATAAGSAFYHASETYAGRLADYAGMHLGASYMLAVNASRWLRGQRPVLVRWLFWITFAVPMAVMLADDASPEPRDQGTEMATLHT